MLFVMPHSFNAFINLSCFQLRELTSGLFIWPNERLKLQKNFISAGLKLVYAFIWQEEFLENQIVYNPILNSFGAKMIPVVNRFANELNSFVYWEQDFQV